MMDKEELEKVYTKIYNCVPKDMSIEQLRWEIHLHLLDSDPIYTEQYKQSLDRYLKEK